MNFLVELYYNRSTYFQYKYADMTASDVAAMLTNFRNLRIQDIKQFGKIVHTCTVTML